MVESTLSLEAFPDEETCLDLLTGLRWKIAPHCPYCRHTKIYHLAKKGFHVCANCGLTFSIKVGTVFQSSCIPMRKWFVAIWFLTHAEKGVTSVQLAKDLGVTQATAWSMLHRLRHAARTATFRRRLGPEDHRAEGVPSAAALGLARRHGYDGKLRLEMPFDEAVERFAGVDRREMLESLANAGPKWSGRRRRRKPPALPDLAQADAWAMADVEGETTGRAQGARLALDGEG